MFGNDFLVFVGTVMWQMYFEYMSTFLKTRSQFFETERAASKILLRAPTSSAPQLFWRAVRVNLPTMRFNPSAILDEEKREWMVT